MPTQPVGVGTVRVRLPRAGEWLMKTAHILELCARADLYHATDFYLPLGSQSTAVATVHDAMFLSDPDPTSVDHARLRRWTPDFVRRCARVITPSEHSKREVSLWLDVAPNRISVIPFGCSSAFRPAEDHERPRAFLRERLGIEGPFFLAVSCSVGRKNTLRVLDAYARCESRGIESGLVLVWEPPLDVGRRYEGTRVRFVGRQPEDVLLALYQATTALVFPSLQEGFGFPVVEAMASGSAVITSNGSSLPEVGGDAAVYVDPHDVEGLSNAMLRLDGDRAELAGRRAAGRVWARRFSWAECAAKTIEVYAKCLEDR